MFTGSGGKGFPVNGGQQQEGGEYPDRLQHEQRFNVFLKIKEIRLRNPQLVATVLELTDPYIFFNDDMVDVRSIDLFYARLDQGIVAHFDGKGKRLAFPVAVHIIIEVFRILVTGQGKNAPAGIEVIG